MSKRKAPDKDEEDDVDDPNEDEEEKRRREDREDDEMQERLTKRSSKDRMGELYEQFVKVATEEQLARFEQFKRSKFPRATMKKLMGDLVGNSTERCAIALASLAKTMVGELVESAKQEMTANGQSGPVQPYHLRQAYRRAQQSGSVPGSDTGTPSLFCRRDCGP
jgi:transcription initiation factor TFIID subunit 11